MEEEIKQIKEVLHQHYFNDLKKPDVDKELRAKIILEYIKENNINLNQFCKRFNIPHTTMVSWMKYNRTTDKYNITVYVPKGKLAINCILDNVIDKLNHKCEINEETKEKIALLEKAINTFKFRHKI